MMVSGLSLAAAAAAGQDALQPVLAAPQQLLEIGGVDPPLPPPPCCGEAGPRGRHCPPSSRRRRWTDYSRAFRSFPSFDDRGETARHRLFDVARFICELTGPYNAGPAACRPILRMPSNWCGSRHAVNGTRRASRRSIDDVDGRGAVLRRRPARAPRETPGPGRGIDRREAGVALGPRRDMGDVEPVGARHGGARRSRRRR